MKLKIRYENTYQTIELSDEDMQSMWIALSLEEEEGLSDKEKESRLQEAFEEQFNRPEYNVWHRETRRIDPTPKKKRMDGRRGYIQADPDDAGFDIMDYLLAASDTEKVENRLEMEDICAWVKKVLIKKPEWADAFIAVRLLGESVREYAMRIGENENNITKKLKRAEKKLREALENRQI